MKPTVIYLDMDGVLADFFYGALKVHARTDLIGKYPKGEYAMEKVLGISTKEFWKPIKEHGHHFWANLDKYGWADELLEICEHIAPTFIATKPNLDPGSASGKMEWLQKWQGKIGGHVWDRFFITPHKKYLAQPGAVLIDDLEENCIKFRACGGTALLFPAQWNSSEESVEEFLKNLEYLKHGVGVAPGG